MIEVPCTFCGERMPVDQLNTHVGAKHAVPTPQDMAYVAAHFGHRQQYTQRRKAVAARKQHSQDHSPNSIRVSGNDSASASFSRWYDDHLSTVSLDVESITTEQISSFSVNRSNHPAHTAEHLQKSAKFDIQELVRRCEGLENDERIECNALVRELPVFACLSAFVFTHLKLCVCVPEKSSLLDDFRSKTQEWIREGDEWCLLNYDSIKGDLKNFLAESQVQDHRCSQELLPGGNVHLSDIHSLAALAIIYSSDKNRAESFYDMKDDQAQSMTDLLQALIDVKESKLDDWYQRRFLDAVIRLSRKSRKYPRSLKITGVEEVTSSDLRGGFGAIFLGKLSGKVVALKELQAAGRTADQFLKDFCQESVVWRNVHHINCLPFYGITTVQVDEVPRTCLVSPWMENGNLNHYLKDNPSAPRLPPLLDIANGLVYLHTMQPTIVHGDLKCLNIFVTTSGRACLADFGLATAHDEQDSGATTTLDVYGTAGYMAPELLRLQRNPELRKTLDMRRSDMFAFGCIVYEVYTGEPPFHGTPSVRNSALEAGHRPPFPKDEKSKKLGLDSSMWDFIEALWANRPETRLVAQSARDFLKYKLLTEGQSASSSRHLDDPEWDTAFLSSLAVTSDPFAL